MAHPYHHALSSVRSWGGSIEDYLAVHAWFDGSKEILADFRHRALRHHAEGIFMSERLFGSDRKVGCCCIDQRHRRKGIRKQRRVWLRFERECDIM